MQKARSRWPLALAVLFGACAEMPTTLAPATDGSLAGAAPAASVTVVMSNLNHPRGLAWGPDGGLYVVEAGAPEVNGPCAPIPGGRTCYSDTGAVSRLLNGQQERFLTGLPSVFMPERNDVAGPHHLSFDRDGGAALTIGWGEDPALRAGLGDLGSRLGTLLRIDRLGNRSFVDIAEFEERHNPDAEGLESNPYGVYAETGRQFVTDAGGNMLLEVAADGTVSLVAVFPRIPLPPGPLNPPFESSEAVPTQVRRGPDGALYVSALTGAPFLPGAAGLYRVVPGRTPRLHPGFTAITDFAFAPDGSGYAIQFASEPFLGGPGSLVHVARDGTRTVIVDDLIAPTGVAVAPDGVVYVTNRSVIPGHGEVLRIVP